MRASVLFILSIFLFLSVASCGKAPRKLYFRDIEGLPSELTQSLSEMVGDLNQSAGKEIISTSRGTKPITIRLTDGAALDATSTLAHARYMEYHCLIEVRDDIEEVIRREINPGSPSSVSQAQAIEGMKYILMHELGHCFGFTHTNEANSLMNASYQTGWDQDSVDDLAARMAQISE